MHHHCGPEGSDRDRSERGWESRGRQRRRKERILHTRVSDNLAEDIRRVAEDLRVPMSNLVRNVLEEAFSVVERVSDDVGELLDEVIDEAERARARMERYQGRRRRGGRREASRSEAAQTAEPLEPPPASVDPSPEPQPEFPEVVAWQSVLLNQERRCAADGRTLTSGEKAFLGLTEQGLSPTYLCADCMEARGAG